MNGHEPYASCEALAFNLNRVLLECQSWMLMHRTNLLSQPSCKDRWILHYKPMAFQWALGLLSNLNLWVQMNGEFHLNYKKDEPSPEFILILFSLPIMELTSNAEASTPHFSNSHCPWSRADWYVPGVPLLGSKWGRWDYFVCMKTVSPNINWESAPRILIIWMCSFIWTSSHFH